MQVKLFKGSPVVFLLTVPRLFPLLQFFFGYASIVSYVAFVLSLLVRNLSFFWCPGKAVVL